MNSSSTEATRLDGLTQDTAAFFMKAPQSSVLEFILAKNALLVEGDAEYILIDELFRREMGCPPEDLDTHIISVGGTSFKRYLELARLLNIRTAVVRDNDGDYQANCVDAYSDYAGDSNISVFSDKDNERRTFEVCVYQDNVDLCEGLISAGRRTRTVQEYMLASKTEAAFSLLQNAADKVQAPAYISDAIRWIRESS